MTTPQDPAHPAAGPVTATRAPRPPLLNWHQRQKQALIAAQRQDAIAAALAQHDFDTSVAAKVDIETLLEINRQQLGLIEELHTMLRRLESAPPPAADPDSSRGERGAHGGR